MYVVKPRPKYTAKHWQSNKRKTTCGAKARRLL